MNPNRVIAIATFAAAFVAAVTIWVIINIFKEQDRSVSNPVADIPVPDTPEADIPKRKPWPFHLTTAVLLMLFTGGLLGVQVNEHRNYPGSEDILQGIPFPMHIRIENPKEGIILGWLDREDNGWNYWMLAANVLLCVIVLITVAFVSEWVIRRREARRTQHQHTPD